MPIASVLTRKKLASFTAFSTTTDDDFDRITVETTSAISYSIATRM
jgi:hypothetical protein